MQQRLNDDAEGQPLLACLNTGVHATGHSWECTYKYFIF